MEVREDETLFHHIGNPPYCGVCGALLPADAVDPRAGTHAATTQSDLPSAPRARGEGGRTYSGADGQEDTLSRADGLPFDGGTSLAFTDSYSYSNLYQDSKTICNTNPDSESPRSDPDTHTVTDTGSSHRDSGSGHQYPDFKANQEADRDAQTDCQTDQYIQAYGDSESDRYSRSDSFADSQSNQTGACQSPQGCRLSHQESREWSRISSSCREEGCSWCRSLRRWGRRRRKWTDYVSSIRGLWVSGEAANPAEGQFQASFADDEQDAPDRDGQVHHHEQWGNYGYRNCDQLGSQGN